MPYLFAAAAMVSSALAAPNHGLEWRTIGDPGNAPTNPAVDHPGLPRPTGAVDYRYRLARTEITNKQAFEFFTAYSPYYVDDGNRLGSWGNITFLGLDGNTPVWSLNELADNRVATLSPRLWVRYVNWLENDKALTEDAFDFGVYDTSTFGEDDEGRLTDQRTRNPGSRFWIPSIDEWVKGGYWDPNKNGPGEGGYWLFPNGTDLPSVPGLPEEGGESNRGGAFNGLPQDVGQYPDTQTPWGLLDYSGGGRELVELVGTQYWTFGTSVLDSGFFFEQLGRDRGAIADFSLVSLRLASVVPSPGAGVLVVAGIGALSRRRRTTAE